MKSLYALCLLCIFIAPQLNAQSGNANADKVEQMRRIKEQIQQDQKTIQQQQEWNNQSGQQEIKKLNQENQQKTTEIQTTKREAQAAKNEAQQAKLALENKKLELLATQLRIDSAKSLLDSTTRQLASSEMLVKRTTEALLHQEDSLKLLNEKRLTQDLQIKNQSIALEAEKAKTRLSAIAAVFVIVLFIVIAVIFVIRQRSMKALEEKNKEIKEEHRKSDALLLNILPQEVMTELKEHGKTKARNYIMASVLFADIKDFTIISEQLSPDDLIEALDAYFERFDNVIEKYSIEKIKTIGDAYVCAGGLPTKDIVNPEMVVQAAVDFVHEIEALRTERTRKGLRTFEFRIGIHTGNLIAGVIGTKKFAYDIWGDTVNMAARMEQNGEPNKINISGTTYELVKNKFACVYRGKIDAKNKGQVDMYFVST